MTERQRREVVLRALGHDPDQVQDRVHGGGLLVSDWQGWTWYSFAYVEEQCRR